jgi:hypothetical protein
MSQACDGHTSTCWNKAAFIVHHTKIADCAEEKDDGTKRTVQFGMAYLVEHSPGVGAKQVEPLPISPKGLGGAQYALAILDAGNAMERGHHDGARDLARGITGIALAWPLSAVACSSQIPSSVVKASVGAD